MASTLWGNGPLSQSAERDDEWHRTYTIVWQCRTDDPLDGPGVVMATSGLLAPGSAYQPGNDSDPVAFVLPGLKVGMKESGENTRFWTVEQKATTKPLKRCMDEQFEDPLLIPDKISGSFAKEKIARAFDRFGIQIKSSSHEPLKGDQTEFDEGRPTVKIEQTVADLELGLLAEMLDGLNDSPLWDLPARCVKLSQVTWEQKWYGTCSYYYTRTLDFEINFKTFDRLLLDEGTKVLHGHWRTADEQIPGTGTGTPGIDADTNDWVLDWIPGVNGSYPDKNNPAHFDRYKDRNGENARVVLNGNGEPYTGLEGTGTGQSFPGAVYVEAYDEYNLLLLGIPTTLAP